MEWKNKVTFYLLENKVEFVRRGPIFIKYTKRTKSG